MIACFTNWTQTYFANHTKKWNHDQLNRFLRNENISSNELWTSVKDDIEYDEDGYIVFDDVVLPKPYAKKIEVLRSQWSGSDKKVVLGIGIVTCLYVNPKTHEYWIIDYRLFDKDHDGKTKIDHVGGLQYYRTRSRTGQYTSNALDTPHAWEHCTVAL